MIGLVVVSHSAKLAEGVCDLARQVARGKVLLAAAGGTADPEHPIGTDAFQVLEAIESVYSQDGVLVLMDLGSAVLSAETALELLDEEKRSAVRLCAAPLVEGTVAAATLAAAGASLEEIAAEARNALGAKAAQLGSEAAQARPIAADQGAPAEEVLATLRNRAGLHARPAAKIVRLVRRYSARLTFENVSTAAGPVPAESINALLGLGARQGHQLRIRAGGSGARQALSEVAAFLESGCGDEEEVAITSQVPAQDVAPGQLSGMPASSGIAIGPLIRLPAPRVDTGSRVAGDPASERHRFTAALDAAREETKILYEWSRAHAGVNAAGIFDAQLLFLEDPALLGEVSRRIVEDGATAEYAWQAVTEKLAGRLSALEDEYQRARAADVEDVAARVARRLTGESVGLPALREPAIIAAHDLTPSEVGSLDRTTCLGLCLERGSPAGHAIILARAMGIPAVVGLGPPIATLPEHTTVAIDGGRGTLWVSPEADLVEELRASRAEWLAERRAAESAVHQPAATRDGRRIRILANVSSVPEAAEALKHGAEGIGVLRTEFLFLGREEPPSEEEQFAAYLTIAQAMGERPLVIRTLDVGGDKHLPYLETGEEANPFLGWRGIRVTLGRREVFRTQLRAILRAGADANVQILLPMISAISEFRETKTILCDVEAELTREGVPFRREVKLGVMIETPAAVAIAGPLAREAAFFSIGTNDLVQYVMAADRTNPRVAAIAEPFQPAVLQMIRQAVEAGRDAGIDVTLCGELAADPLATPLLIGLGLEELSVSALLIPELKSAVGRWSTAEAEAIARKALLLDSSQAVRHLLQSANG